MLLEVLYVWRKITGSRLRYNGRLTITFGNALQKYIKLLFHTYSFVYNELNK